MILLNMMCLKETYQKEMIYNYSTKKKPGATPGKKEICYEIL